MSRTNILSSEFRMPCTSCSKRFKPSNLLDKVVHSIAIDNFYLIKVCKKCFDLNHIVCKHGKRELEPEEVAWVCKCGTLCNTPEETEEHVKATGHNGDGHLALRQKPIVKQNQTEV